MVIHDLKMTDAPEKEGHTNPSLVIDPDEFEGFLGKNWDREIVSFDEIVVIFLDYAIGQNGSLPSSRQPFFAPQPFRKLVSLLLDHGYLEDLDGPIQWADTICPAMQRCGLWNDDCKCSIEVEQAEFELQIKEALDQMPQFVRKILENAKVQVPVLGRSHFHEAVLQYWDGSDWVSPRSDTRWEMDDKWYRGPHHIKFCEELLNRLS